MDQRRLLPIAVACLVLLAGCSATLGGGGDTSPSSATATTTAPTTDAPPPTTDTAEPTTTPPRESYPEPSANLSNESVEETMIEYEEARLHNELRNRSSVESFDISYMYPTTATVLNRSGGVYLRVEGHYSYGTGESVADGVPVESLYFANESIIWRVTELG